MELIESRDEKDHVGDQHKAKYAQHDKKEFKNIYNINDDYKK